MISIPSPFVAMIPGGGWCAEYRDDYGLTWSEPIACWTMNADGETSR